MDNILDFDDQNKFVDHLHLESFLLDDIVKLLDQNNIVHRVRENKHLEDMNYNPNSNALKFGASNYTIQVPVNSQLRVDDLLKQNIELLHGSIEVRDFFLSHTLDEEGLIDVLLFPEEWEIGDEELVIKILAKKGISIPKSEYKARRLEREKVREDNQEVKDKKEANIYYWAFILFICICILLWELNS